MDDEVTLTVLLLGDEGVGKTTFLSRVSAGDQSSLDGPMPPGMRTLRDLDQPFVFELRGRRGRRFRLEFRDVDGPGDWRLLRPDLVLACYDVGRRATLARLQTVWINELRSAFHRGGDAPPIMVAGLKRDLRGPPPQNGGDANDGPEAAAFPEEGYRAAQEMRVDGYVECSAATGELLRLAFEEICRAAVETASVDGGGGSSGGDADGGCVIL